MHKHEEPKEYTMVGTMVGLLPRKGRATTYICTQHKKNDCPLQAEWLPLRMCTEKLKG